jgi:hypothetical protein
LSIIFDEITNNDGDLAASAVQGHPETHLADGQYTASALKTAVQDLLKFGVLEAERKPNLYQLILTHHEQINRILEPLDLRLKVDAVRGMVFLLVAQGFVAENALADVDDEWSHPLVRRQRFTLEQSLLVAILRQLFVLHEQESGIGASAALVHLDDLLPHVQLYLGDLGSDAREQKRLRNLLDNLKSHGLVSDVDEKDQFTIRPIITHLADPQSLQNLLLHFRQLASQAKGSRSSAQSLDEGDE